MKSKRDLDRNAARGLTANGSRRTPNAEPRTPNPEPRTPYAVHRTNNARLGLFITWTVCGTFLLGDARGWRHRKQGRHTSRPRLEQWHRDRLKHPIVLLDSEMQVIAEAALSEICGVRKWTVWAVSIRTNHVQVVVTEDDIDSCVIYVTAQYRMDRNK